MNITYIPRIIDEELSELLSIFGGVLIEGPKWCGKTTTGTHFSKSEIHLQNPSVLETAKIHPEFLLKGDVPLLIDEWQEAPSIWDLARAEIDSRQEPGQFILTGSTSIKWEKARHTGTGRIARLKMYPMSLYESGHSNGEISLKDLFYGQNSDINGAHSDLSVSDLIYAACRGGWPFQIKKKDQKYLRIAKDYVRQIVETDISSVDGIKKNSEWTKLILHSYSRNIATLASKRSILHDVSSNAASFSMATLDSYIHALERLFVIEDMDAWNPSIRSKTSIRSGKKRMFTDPSIAIASLGLSPDYFEKDLYTFGFIFECLCVRDLRVYSQALGGQLSYYRDRSGLEADAVLHINDGKYALIEFKLGSNGIETGAQHLLKIRDLIRTEIESGSETTLRDPDLLIVITAGEYAYMRDDDVMVIPIGCLRS